MPAELRNVSQIWTETEGLPHDNNHDPSNIIFWNGVYYLWVTQHLHGKSYDHFKNCKIMLTTSNNGYHWGPLKDALLPSTNGWDCGGVLTANITVYGSTFYLFYTGVDKEFGISHSLRYVGYAISDSPCGPWERCSKPIFGPSGKGFDEDSADDVTMLYRDNKFWMYYKGMYPGLDGNKSKTGVAFADNITGPYIRYKNNPLITGHAFAIWPYKNGYLYLSGLKDTEEGTMYNDHPEWFDPRGTQSLFWSDDGLRFESCCPFENRAVGIYAGSTRDLTKCWGVSVKTINGHLGRYITRFDFQYK